MEKPLKYLSYTKSFEENRKIYRNLCMQHHPDKKGDEELMKAINDEWGIYNKNYKSKTSLTDSRTPLSNSQAQTIWDILEVFFQEEEEEQDESEYITFKGNKYLIDNDILNTIALRHGGMGLLEFVNSKEWQEYLNR